MKTNIICFLLMVTMVFFSTSCSDDFLDQTPTDAVTDETATSTLDGLFLVVNGIHRLLYTRQGSNGRGGISAMMIQNDALGEDMVMNARANGWWINMASWNDHTNANDTDDRHAWRVLYKVVKNANIIIEAAPDAVGEEENRNIVLGQAHAYRAFAHFHMVRLYAQRYDAAGSNDHLGIPVIIDNAVDGRPRATVQEVYTQINSDLDLAIPLLEDYNRPNASHINQNVAIGLKARVSLAQGNYAVAAEMAAMAREGFSLMDSTTYASGFNDYTIDEWMWGGHYNEEQGSPFTNFHAWISRNFSSSNIRGNPKSINSLLYDQIPSTDVRSAIFDPTGEHPNLPVGIEISSRHKRFPYTNQKFLAFGTGDSRGDVPYMRASEMYLIEAEAKARLGDLDAAEALYPLASARDAAYVLSTNTGQDLIDEILLQRRWELWGEGFRFFDLKRLNIPLDRNGANHNSALINNVMFVPAGDVRWQWQIPQNEIDANPTIVQNPS